MSHTTHQITTSPPSISGAFDEISNFCYDVEMASINFLPFPDTHQEEALLIKMKGQMKSGPVASYLRRLSESSRKTIRTNLYQLLVALNPEYLTGLVHWLQSNRYNRRDSIYLFDWHSLRYEHTSLIRGLLIQRYKPKMVNQILTVLRQTLKECWRLGLMSFEEHQRAADISSVRNQSLLSGRAVQAHEIKALIEHCNLHDLRDIRNAAIIALFFVTGLRCSEVSNLDLADYNPLEKSLRVIGKRRKERTVYLNDEAIGLLNRWLAVRGYNPGALFVNIRPRHKLHELQRYQPCNIAHMLKQKGKLAGLPKLSPHDLRRGSITTLLEHGADVLTVSRIAGHSSVDTTRRYDRRDENAKRSASSLLDLPFSVTL